MGVGKSLKMLAEYFKCYTILFQWQKLGGGGDVIYLAGNFCFANMADLIGAKGICSQTQFSHIMNRLLTLLVRSLL